MLFFDQESHGLRVEYPDMSFPVRCQNVVLSDIVNNSLLTFWHEDVVLIQNLTKPVTFRVHTDEIVLEVGDLILINCSQLHSCRCDEADGCLRVFLFHPSLLRGVAEPAHPFWQRIEDCGLRFVCWRAASRQAQLLRPLMEHVQEEASVEGAKPLELLALACLTAAFFSEESAPASNLSPREKKDANAVRVMLAYIVQHYAEKLSLDTVAEKGGVSRSKCCKLFGAYVGTTPMDYLSTLRLKIAVSLLNDPSLSIRMIAERCGFPEQSYFTRLFKARFHDTPGRCRRLTDEAEPSE